MPRESEIVRELVSRDLLGPDTLLDDGVEALAPEKYELVRRIGRGGSGVVWLAHDRTLDRDVALKFLRDGGAAHLERFRREARVTARLDCSSIVRVHELGEHEGQAYIAMQFVEGTNLHEAELGSDEVVRTVREVATALAYTHSQGIVHRDIKPQNILVDGNGRPHLTDFGIARDLTGRTGDTLSVHGQIMGTPALMPPEQARGEHHAVDARSDVYALGATLFAKLAGCEPFRGRSVVDVLHAVLHEEAPLLRSCAASAPRSLEAIVWRCMRKSRAERYGSMHELIADLERYLEGAELTHVPQAWFRKLVSRVVGAPEPDPEPDTEVDLYSTAGVEIVREIAAWDADLYRVTGSLERSFARLDVVRERLETILADRPDTAWARFYRGLIHFRQGRLEDALDDAESAIDGVHDLASAYFELGRLYLALYLVEQHRARKHVTQAGVDDDLRAAGRRLDQAALAFEEARQRKGTLAAWHRAYAKAVRRLAEQDFAGCEAVCDAVLADEPDLEEVWRLRGDAQRLGGRDPIASYERALEVRRSDYGALFALAEVYLDRAEPATAQACLERALVIHPVFHDARALLARTHFVAAQRGSEADREQALRRVVRLAEDTRRLAPSNYESAVLLAEAQLERARLARSAELFAAAEDVLDHARQLQGCQNRVNLLRATIHVDRARLGVVEGDAARRELATALELCREHLALVSDHRPWQEMQRVVEGELGSR